MSRMETLTPEQLAALRAYAGEFGRSWKAKLNRDWMSGQSCGPLQHVRNQFGPSWLVRFSFKSYEAGNGFLE
jgi:hypothetical protein